MLYCLILFGKFIWLLTLTFKKYITKVIVILKMVISLEVFQAFTNRAILYVTCKGTSFGVIIHTLPRWHDFLQN